MKDHLGCNGLLVAFFNEQKALCDKQFGFQNVFSIVHTIINITENVKKVIDNKLFVCGIFIDLQKAFDAANHNV